MFVILQLLWARKLGTSPGMPLLHSVLKLRQHCRLGLYFTSKFNWRRPCFHAFSVAVNSPQSIHFQSSHGSLSTRLSNDTASSFPQSKRSERERGKGSLHPGVRAPRCKLQPVYHALRLGPVHTTGRAVPGTTCFHHIYSVRNCLNEATEAWRA